MLTDNHLHPRLMTSPEHVDELIPVTALGGKLVRNSLVVGPPCSTDDVLLRRADWKVGE